MPDWRIVNPQVELIGKPECHLCEDARSVVAEVCSTLGLAWTERSILAEAELFDEYWDKIPVVLIDGRIWAFWRVEREALQARLSE